MSVADQTALDAYLKKVYVTGVPQNLAMRKKVALSWMDRKDDLYGKSLTIPLMHANIAGRSATITNLVDAGSQTGATQQVAFEITAASDYAGFGIDAKTMMSMKKDVGAFAEARKMQVDSGLDEIAKSLEIGLWGSGSGSLGRRLSASTNVITLYNARDVRNFYKGQWINASATETGGAVRAGAGTTVASVDQDAGTVTLASAAGITSFTDGDYLYTAGDYDLKVKGFSAWIPLTTPSATTFFGVDRTQNVQALSGHRLAASSNTIEEQIMQLCERIVDFGGSPDTCFLSHTNFNTVSKSLGSKIEYSDGGGTATMGFEGIRIATSAGILKVSPAPYCPDDRGYVLQKDTWKLHTLGEVPHIVQDDGLMVRAARTTDGVEGRIRYYCQPACNAPGWNGVFGI